ncbi:hypothetical protein B0H11DRAFT_1732752, partial [Mycena galericulata]
LQVAGPDEHARIVDAICARGGEMMMHRFGNTSSPACGTLPPLMLTECTPGGCVVDLATNFYGWCHVVQRAVDCEEEEVLSAIFGMLLVRSNAGVFLFVEGPWASLTCHDTGSLVVQVCYFFSLV